MPMYAQDYFINFAVDFPQANKDAILSYLIDCHNGGRRFSHVYAAKLGRCVVSVDDPAMELTFSFAGV